jgi:hypothetical protein
MPGSPCATADTWIGTTVDIEWPPIIPPPVIADIAEAIAAADIMGMPGGCIGGKFAGIVGGCIGGKFVGITKPHDALLSCVSGADVACGDIPGETEEGGGAAAVCAHQGRCQMRGAGHGDRRGAAVHRHVVAQHLSLLGRVLHGLRCARQAPTAGQSPRAEPKPGTAKARILLEGGKAESAGAGGVFGGATAHHGARSRALAARGGEAEALGLHRVRGGRDGDGGADRLLRNDGHGLHAGGGRESGVRQPCDAQRIEERRWFRRGGRGGRGKGGRERKCGPTKELAGTH